MVDERKPKREKPKRKRKRDESIFPHVAIFAAAIVLIVGVAGVFLLRQDQQLPCADTDSGCEFATPTPIANPLFPTPTPLLPPELVGRQPSNDQSPMISSLALSPDEQYLLIGLNNPYRAEVLGEVVSMRLDQSEEGQPTFTEDMSEWELTQTQLRKVDDIDIQPDGDFFTLASTVNQAVEVYDVSLDNISGANSELPTYASYSDAAFSPDGRYLAVAGNDGISLRDAATQDELASIEANPGEPMVIDLVFTSDSSTLVVAHSEVMSNNMSPYLEIWQVDDDSLSATQPVLIDRVIIDMVAHPTLNQVAIAMPGQIDIYDLDSQQHESYPIQQTPAITALTYHPTGGVLAFGGSHDAITGSLYGIPLGDDGFPVLSDGAINVNTMGFTSGPVSELLYNGSGATLFVGTTNGLLLAWDALTSQNYDDYIFPGDQQP